MSSSYRFLKSWFQIIVGEPEEQLKQLEQLESVTADCVGRFVISSERMPIFIEALQTNFDRHLEKQKQKDTE